MAFVYGAISIIAPYLSRKVPKDVANRATKLLTIQQSPQALTLARLRALHPQILGISQEVYTAAMLGVYELTRIELLRDLYLWAYRRSTQEYLVIQQNLAEPDPVRLAYGAVIKRIVHDVVVNPTQDALTLLRNYLREQAIPEEKRADVLALTLEELRRLHEGVLARYGLRPFELAAWQARRDVNLYADKS